MLGENENEIIIYTTEDGKETFEVNLKEETVWLNLNQISKLFERDKSVISRHIRNIFETEELSRRSVVANFATTATDGKVYKVDFYNLDLIISVGYRVNSKRGTQFRIWATNVLKNHLIQGYTINQKRLQESKAKIKELQKTCRMIERLLLQKNLESTEATGLLQVILDYQKALHLLDEYDHQELEIKDITTQERFKLTYEKARKELGKLKGHYTSGLFGLEKDQSFASSIGAIYQSFDGKEVYPSIEEKAANLLYFVVKNHSFVDGNKRIAASLFLWFLNENGILYKEDGSKRIADNALVALTLLIAESLSEEKDIMIKVIVNLINKEN